MVYLTRSAVHVSGLLLGVLQAVPSAIQEWLRRDGELVKQKELGSRLLESGRLQ